MVIAKGQANYETLEGYPRPIYFLLKVKCPLVGNHIGSEVGSLVVNKNTFTASEAENQRVPSETVIQNNNPNQKG
jgi:damage-control phosphatase, subfamily I